MEAAQKARYPNKFNKKLMRMVVGKKIAFKRPVSVEHEQRNIERSRARHHLYLGFIVVAIGACMGFVFRKAGGGFDRSSNLDTVSDSRI